MFERLTERNRRAVVLGQNEASRLKHDHVGTGHLLVGLLQAEDEDGGGILSSGMNVEAVRSGLEEVSGFGEEDTSMKPFSQAMKRIFEVASQTALGSGKNYIGTEHLLLALLDDHERTAAQVLKKRGFDREELRAEVEVSARNRDY